MYKQLSHEIKDIDEQGIVTAYANVYNVEDSDGDISAQGSFRKTATEQRKRIRVLKDHNPTQSLGVPIEINPDDPKGLLTVTKFNLKKDLAKDMFTDIKLYMEHGLNAELSIGYSVQKRNTDDPRIIEEYKLFEYSFLTGWAANELSTVTGIKNDVPNGIKSHYAILELITKAYDMDYSDSRLKQIETLLISLTQEPEQSHYSKSQAEKISEVFNSFNKKSKIEGIFNEYRD
jgi:HK97 family phage prohead protease